MVVVVVVVVVYNLITLLLWWQHAEPSLDEFLPVQTQLELEHKHREEEDAMYRKFLQVLLPVIRISLIKSLM